MKLRDRVEGVVMVLAMPLLPLVAPFVVGAGAWRRAQYRRRERGAVVAELRFDETDVSVVGDEVVELAGAVGVLRLWEWYIQGGTASNDELNEQILELRLNGHWRCYRLSRYSYSCAEDLRSRGLKVRGIRVLSDPGLLWLFAWVGLFLWAIVFAVLWRC